ncbi:hypothetical protein [Deefgea sp. CFH1-16]|uniref:hypothetical protein n=1 Tax=Deefgea sp. CFH1-16 TaxID=2675457 RepID=UPI0015F5CC00|nr:hypothetical protein [Deefgea sp. CFH1-16]MBM5575632.1 hypothetical protein [Deefgea sp. CFH1-16]
MTNRTSPSKPTMNYIDDRAGHEPSKPNRILPIIVFAGILSAALLGAYRADVLPHYTFLIDGNKVELIRDDAKYLAEQAQKGEAIDEANRKIIAANRKTLDAYAENTQDLDSTLEVQHSDPSSRTIVINHHQPAVANSAQVVKCLSDEGRVVYQASNCLDNGLTPVKVLSTSELQHSRADAFQTNATSTSADPYKPAIARINNESKRNSPYCKNIESERERIRAQQRANSTQYLRDQYNQLSKIWYDDCFNT